MLWCTCVRAVTLSAETGAGNRTRTGNSHVGSVVRYHCAMPAKTLRLAAVLELNQRSLRSCPYLARRTVPMRKTSVFPECQPVTLSGVAYTTNVALYLALGPRLAIDSDHYGHRRLFVTPFFRSLSRPPKPSEPYQIDSNRWHLSRLLSGQHRADGVPAVPPSTEYARSTACGDGFILDSLYFSYQSISSWHMPRPVPGFHGDGINFWHCEQVLIYMLHIEHPFPPTSPLSALCPVFS